MQLGCRRSPSSGPARRARCRGRRRAAPGGRRWLLMRSVAPRVERGNRARRPRCRGRCRRPRRAPRRGRRCAFAVEARRQREQHVVAGRAEHDARREDRARPPLHRARRRCGSRAASDRRAAAKRRRPADPPALPVAPMKGRSAMMRGAFAPVKAAPPGARLRPAGRARSGRGSLVSATRAITAAATAQRRRARPRSRNRSGRGRACARARPRRRSRRRRAPACG